MSGTGTLTPRAYKYKVTGAFKANHMEKALLPFVCVCVSDRECVCVCYNQELNFLCFFSMREGGKDSSH